MSNDQDELTIILEKLDKADADRAKILNDLDTLSKTIAENHLKIIQLENRVDRLDAAVDESYPIAIKHNKLEKRVGSLEASIRWVSILLILVFLLLNTFLFVFIK